MYMHCSKPIIVAVLTQKLDLLQKSIIDLLQQTNKKQRNNTELTVIILYLNC